MEVTTNARGHILPRATMKRICSLCLQERMYHKVKKYEHQLQLCTKCQDVIIELSLTATSILRH